MSQRKDFCGTAKVHQAMMRRRHQRIEAGDTKLSELVQKLDQTAKAYAELQRRLIEESLQARDIAAGDTASLMQKSVEAAAFEEARQSLNAYESELNRAELDKAAADEDSAYADPPGMVITLGRGLGAMVGPAPVLPEPKFDIKRRDEIFNKLKELRADAALNGLSEEANAQMDELEEELRKILAG